MAEPIIEVAVTESTSDTQRGQLLVDLMRDVFDATNYASGPTIRVTGMEIDVTATHTVTHEEVYAECKAHRDPIPADALTKLLGNVIMRSVAQGWLVTTSRLSKDAEGLRIEWEKKPSEDSRRLQVYTPSRLLKLLVDSNRIIDPARIVGTSVMQQSDWYLLITDLGRYWAQLAPEEGVPSKVTVYDARTGAPIDNVELLRKLRSTDTSLSDLNWVTPVPERADVAELSTHLPDIVVDVIEGDSWADYRPARPQDFIGRHDLQEWMLGFFRSIRDRSTNTRLFSIRSPSGWGKSSLIAKLRNRCGNRANRHKFHLMAVDVRAAKSANYVSAALLRSFSSAIEQKFILPPVMPLQAGPPATPLTSESLQDCLQQLRAKGRVLILVFDQFEEVLTKPDLRLLFDRLRLLALTVDAQEENLALGFAWKSDAFVPQDHPAYYLWHQLKDRRLDLDLPRFGSKDVSQVLRLFQSELEQRLNPILRSQLAQHCQGFPWLLKKLCIHVFNLVKSGLTQTQVLERSLDVSGLFHADLSELSPRETLCLKEIAKVAPADWVQIVEQFGNDTYTSLLDKRLIIRSGDRLNPYWDIFRDYLRTGEAPHVPVSFLPGTEVRTLIRAAIVTWIHRQGDLTVTMLSTQLSINSRSAGNVVRDLQMFGLANRDGDKIVLTIDVGDAGGDVLASIARSIASALENHVFTLTLRRDVARDSTITEQDLLKHFNEAFPYATLRDDTKRLYALRLAKYLVVISFFERSGSGWRLIDRSPGQLVMMPRVRGTGQFLGDAPAEKVLELITRLARSPTSRVQLDQSGLRNAVTCAIMLELVYTGGGLVRLRRKTRNAEALLAKALTQTRSFQIISELIHKSPSLSAIEIGKVLAERLDLPWSDATCLRRGGALRKWVRWYTDYTSKQSPLK